MPLVETQKTTTATTDRTDAELVEILRAEAGRRTADPPFRPGDVVQFGDATLIARWQLIRPFGVVMTSDPLRKSSVVLCLDIHGEAQPIFAEADMDLRAMTVAT